MENEQLKSLQPKASSNRILFWVIALFIIALLSGLAGYYLGMNAIRKSSLINTQQANLTNKKSKNAATSSTDVLDPKIQQLIAVAKKVFWAESYPDAGYALAFCQFGKTCPFTNQLYKNFTNEHNPPGDWGAWFAPGFQNGPFGTLSYLATPSSTGGTVYITLIPTESYIKDPGGDGENSLVWNLTLTNTNGELLVNNMTFATGPFYGNSDWAEKPCGPVNIYDYVTVCH